MARNDSNLSFSSAFRYQRVFDSGSFDSSTTSSITHDLGYRPFVRIAAQYSDGSFGNVSNAGQTPYGSASAKLSIFYTVGTTDIQFTVFDNTFSGDSATIYYKIYADSQT